MRIISRCTVKILALLVAAAAGGAQAATIVYDNSANPLGTFMSVAGLTAEGNEFGDQITLAASPERWLTQLKVGYYGGTSVTGIEKARFRIYANDGALTGGGTGMRAPSTLLYDSGTPSSLSSGYNFFSISGEYILVPDSFTWTVQFSGVTGPQASDIGLLLNDPPTVGSSFDDFWEKEGTGWTTKRLSGTPFNFDAQVLAVVPEPTTLAFGLLAGLMGMGYWGYRRTQKPS